MKFFTPSGAASADICRGTVAYPRRDWIVVCSVFGVLFISLIVFDVWMYLSSAATADLGSGAVPSDNSPVTAFTPENLNAVIAQYSAFSAEHAQLVATPPTVTDPAK